MQTSSSSGLKDIISNLSTQNIFFEASWTQTNSKNALKHIGHSLYVLITKINPNKLDDFPKDTLCLFKTDHDGWLKIDGLKEENDSKIELSITSFDLQKYLNDGVSLMNLIFEDSYIWIKTINLFRELSEIEKFYSQEKIDFESYWRETTRENLLNDIGESKVVLIEIHETPGSASPNHAFCLEKLNCKWMIRHGWKEEFFEDFDINELLRLDENSYFQKNPKDRIWIKTQDFSAIIHANYELNPLWGVMTLQKAMESFKEFLVGLKHHSRSIYQAFYLRKVSSDWIIADSWGIDLDVGAEFVPKKHKFSKDPETLFDIKPFDYGFQMENTDTILSNYNLHEEWHAELNLEEAMMMGDCLLVGVNDIKIDFRSFTGGIFLVEENLEWKVKQIWGMSVNNDICIKELIDLLKQHKLLIKYGNSCPKVKSIDFDGKWRVFQGKPEEFLKHVQIWKYVQVTVGLKNNPISHSAFIIERKESEWKVLNVWGKYFAKNLNLQDFFESKSKYFYGHHDFIFYKVDNSGIFVIREEITKDEITDEITYGPFNEIESKQCIEKLSKVFPHDRFVCFIKEYDG